MVKRRERTGLGRGLSALMADIETQGEPVANDGTAEAPTAPRGVRVLPIDRIVPNPDQPRRSFAEDALNELADSIREKGVIQPLIVGPIPVTDRGSRSWLANAGGVPRSACGCINCPSSFGDFDDTEVLEVAIIEKSSAPT